MNKFLQAVAELLPLKIEEILWDGDTLVLSSADWRFKTESVWRVSKNNEIQFTCWDSSACNFVSDFIGCYITAIGWLVEKQPIDPCFKLSDGRVLSVFCSLSADPWFMEFSGGEIYLGNS